MLSYQIWLWQLLIEEQKRTIYNILPMVLLTTFSENVLVAVLTWYNIYIYIYVFFGCRISAASPAKGVGPFWANGCQLNFFHLFQNRWVCFLSAFHGQSFLKAYFSLPWRHIHPKASFCSPSFLPQQKEKRCKSTSISDVTITVQPGRWAWMTQCINIMSIGLIAPSYDAIATFLWFGPLD